MFFKIGILKNLENFKENTCVGASFLKTVGLKASNLVKNRLQHQCFPVKFRTFLRTPPVAASMFCKGFVDISYENPLFLMLKDFMWLQLIYFLTTTLFLVYGMSFFDWWSTLITYSRVLQNLLCVLFID